MDRIYLNFAYDDDNLFGNRVILNRQDNGVLVITTNPLPDSTFLSIIPKNYRNKKRITLIYKCKCNRYFIQLLDKKMNRFLYYVRKFREVDSLGNSFTSQESYYVYKGITQAMVRVVGDVISNSKLPIEDRLSKMSID